MNLKKIFGLVLIGSILALLVAPIGNNSFAIVHENKVELYDAFMFDKDGKPLESFNDQWTQHMCIFAEKVNFNTEKGILTVKNASFRVFSSREDFKKGNPACFNSPNCPIFLPPSGEYASTIENWKTIIITLKKKDSTVKNFYQLSTETGKFEFITSEIPIDKH